MTSRWHRWTREGMKRYRCGRSTSRPGADRPLAAGPAPPSAARRYRRLCDRRYRNLFVEQLGASPAETQARIERGFQQLFHGDGQEQRIYFETGANANGTLAYVTDWANNDVRTEGMSYGMMIAVQLGHKREFDALWNWSKTYMQVTDPEDPSVGYFAWSFNTDGTPRSTGAAPDGEEYYAMALLFAAHRWGNGRGIYDYQAEAEKILRACGIILCSPACRLSGSTPAIRLSSSPTRPGRARTTAARRPRRRPRASRGRPPSAPIASRVGSPSGRWSTRPRT